MKNLSTICLTIVLIFIILPKTFSQQFNIPTELFSRAERTWYQETSLNADVKAFCEAVGRLSNYAHTEVFGRTKEGNDLIIVVLANPKVTSPAEAAATGKPVIYIQGNIHAGEVEGKEACLQLTREICFGTKTPLIDNQIIIFCPNYNPDGNDKLSATSRPSQDGSPLLTGARVSGEGYDLNREGIKLEAIEAKAFMKNIILRWDPALLIDLHTDNGSWHGYTINYAPCYKSAGLDIITGYVKDKMLPAATLSMTNRSGIPIWFFGNLTQKPGELPVFSTYSHLPRYIVNYMGLRNRMAILSETFSHDSFEKRVLSNYLFLVSILEFTNSNATEIKKIIAAADAETIKTISEKGGIIERGVTYRIAEADKPFPLLMRETEEYKSEDGRVRRRATGKLYWVDSVRYFDHFLPDKTAKVPYGYIFPAELKGIADKLQEHGINVTVIEKRKVFEGEQFIITKYAKETRAIYGGHNPVKVEGDFRKGKFTADKGSYYVDMRQPLAWLVFYMLEPESDDGLLFWNFFDEYLTLKGVENGNIPYPVLKILKPY
ncbi:MAG TPA: M14 family metallopeptidase [Bacteroidales bacterium]|nr:M14 family metallopeptidase [Bacteroidales bacterium]